MDRKPVAIENYVSVVGDSTFSILGIAAELEQFASGETSCHGNNFDRKRESTQHIHLFAFIDNAKKLVCSSGNYFFASQSPATAFYQFESGIALVSAVDVEIECTGAVQVKHVNTDGFEAFFSGV